MNIKPLRNSLVVKVDNREEASSGGIILVPDEKNKRYAKGTIINLGENVQKTLGKDNFDICLDDTILFDLHFAVFVPGEKNIAIIPAESIICGYSKIDSTANISYDNAPLFEVPDAAEFYGDGYWKKFQNLTEFSFRINFLEHFNDAEPLILCLYEHVVRGLRDVDTFELRYIKFNKKENGYVVELEHDYWSGQYIYLTDKNMLAFRKYSTDMSNLFETLPRFMSILYNFLQDRKNHRYFGDRHNRICFTSMYFEQDVQLEGIGVDRNKIYNSDIMRELIKLKSYGGVDTKPAILESLGFDPTKTGRTDIKLSFDKDIFGKTYLVWCNIAAPLNEDKGKLFISWEIAEERPGCILSQQYGPIFYDFFKKKVLAAFYKEWFQEITVSLNKR